MAARAEELEPAANASAQKQDPEVAKMAEITVVLSKLAAESVQIKDRIRLAADNPEPGLVDSSRQIDERIQKLEAERAQLREKLAIKLELTTLDIQYIERYIYPKAEELLRKITAAAYKLEPDPRLQALKQLLPTLAALPVDPAILQESPRIRDLPRWNGIYHKEIAAKADFMHDKAVEINATALEDLRAAMREFLVGNEAEPGLIPILENAIASAVAKFEEAKVTFLLENNLERRFSQAVDDLRNVAAVNIKNQDEARHYEILLQDFVGKLQANVTAAQARFAQVIQTFPAQAMLVEKLAIVVKATQDIPALHIVEADELAHYTFLLDRQAGQLQGLQAAAQAKFTQIVQRLQPIESRAERLQLVLEAIKGIADLAIAKVDEREQYAALLRDLAKTLDEAVQTAEQILTSKFAGLLGFDHLTAVQAECKKFITDEAGYETALQVDAKAHLIYLLKRSCHDLEEFHKVALTDFDRKVKKGLSLKDRLAAHKAELAAGQAQLAAFKGGQASAPKLLQVVTAVVAEHKGAMLEPAAGRKTPPPTAAPQ